MLLLPFKKTVVAVLGMLLASSASFASLPELKSPISDATITLAGDVLEVDLRDHFDVPVSGPIAQFRTVLGDFNVELFAEDTPVTVDNFLAYADVGHYDGVIFHRLVKDFVLQGGGFTADAPPFYVYESLPIVNEFKHSNVRGTIAMAKLSTGPDTATNQWFFNLADNSGDPAYLDTQNGGFTVFGRVMGTGMSVVDAFANQEIWNLGSPFDSLPLIDFDGQSLVGVSNLATINSVWSIGKFPGDDVDGSVLSVSTTNSNLDALLVDETNGILTLVPSDTVIGEATIEVKVTDTNGNEAMDTFNVSVLAPPPTISSQPLGRAVVMGEKVTLSVSATGLGDLIYQWKRNGIPIDGAVGADLDLGEAKADHEGEYTVEVSYLNQMVESAVARLDFVDEFARLVNISTRGYVGVGDQVMIAGVTISGNSSVKPMLVRAVGPGLTDEFGLGGAITDPLLWFMDSDLQLETSNDDWMQESDFLENVETMGRVGAFALVENSKDAAMTRNIEESSFTGVFLGNNEVTGIGLAEIYDADLNPLQASSRITNLSTRAEVRTGEGATVAGFVVEGDSQINLLIRGVGPSLADQLTLTNGTLLENPTIALFKVGENGELVAVASNDNWGDHPSAANLKTINSEVGAFDLVEQSKDASMFVTVDSGSYIVVLSGVDGGTGIGLVELYEYQGERQISELAALDEVPSALHQVAPTYPASLLNEGTGGYVDAEWVILKDGTVTRVRVIESSHVEFEDPVIEAIGQSLWNPGIKDGVAVNTRVKQRISFNP